MTDRRTGEQDSRYLVLPLTRQAPGSPFWGNEYLSDCGAGDRQTRAREEHQAKAGEKRFRYGGLRGRASVGIQILWQVHAG